MRTTVEIEDQLYEEIKRRAANSSKSIREVIDGALRAAFLGKRNRKKKFTIRPHHSPFKGGIDEDKLRKTIDELDIEERQGNLKPK